MLSVLEDIKSLYHMTVRCQQQAVHVTCSEPVQPSAEDAFCTGVLVLGAQMISQTIL